MENARILCLDDSVIELEILKHQLRGDKNRAYDVAFFTSPESAKEKILQNEYDVIILDYQLPGTTGLAIYDFIQTSSLNAKTPVIMMTGEGDEIIAVEAMKRGVFDYFVKGNINNHLFQRSIGYAIEKKDLTKKRGQVDAQRKIMQMKMVSQSKLVSMGEMAAGVAHEIFQPLSVIRGNLELMEMDLEGGEIKNSEWLGIFPVLYRNIDKIQTIVDHLKVFGRNSENQKMETAITYVLENVLFVWKQKFEQDGIRVIKEFAEDLPILFLEKGETEQVLMNLFQNAHDSLGKKDGEREILISAGIQTTPEMELWLEIKDNGNGIRKEHLDKIFEPFFTTKEGNQGMGLGLSVAYAVITSMGGNVDVKSEYGKYASFTLRFPEKLFIQQ